MTDFQEVNTNFVSLYETPVHFIFVYKPQKHNVSEIE